MSSKGFEELLNESLNDLKKSAKISSAADVENPLWSKALCPYLSYFALLSGSDKTSYASETSLNFSSASGSLFLSGWYFIANLR